MFKHRNVRMGILCFFLGELHIGTVVSTSTQHCWLPNTTVSTGFESLSFEYLSLSVQAQ